MNRSRYRTKNISLNAHIATPDAVLKTRPELPPIRDFLIKTNIKARPIGSCLKKYSFIVLK